MAEKRTPVSRAGFRLGSLRSIVLFALAALCLPYIAGAVESGAWSRLQLFAKNPSDWKIESRGARGALLFRQESGEFSFRGEKLEPLTEYALVRYADAPPLADFIAQGKTDRLGELRLSGTWRRWIGKIWLVLAADVERSGAKVRAKAWHPQRYLFEEKELGAPCDCEAPL